MRKKFSSMSKRDIATKFFTTMILFVLLSPTIYLIGYTTHVSAGSRDTGSDHSTMISELLDDSIKSIPIAELIQSSEHYAGESVRVVGFLRLLSDGVPAYLQDGVETVKLDLLGVDVPDSYNHKKIEIKGHVRADAGKQITIEVTDLSLMESDTYSTRSTRTLQGDQNVVVVMARFNDIPNTRYTVADMDNMIFGPQDSVNGLYYECSYHNINITGDVVGWYDLPENRSDYIPTDALGKEDQLNTDFDKLVKDAIDLSDPDVDFDLYDGIVVVINGAFFRGLGIDQWQASTDEGKKTMMATIVGENPGDLDHEVWGRIAHEVGHMLGLKHETPKPDEYNNPFCLMASLYPGHLCAWHKMRDCVDWLPSANVQTVEPGSIETYTVLPLENMPIGGDVYAIKVTITNKLYYMVEVRRFIGYDAYVKLGGDYEMPDEGVIIYLVNEDRKGPIDVMDSKNVPADDLSDAPWDVGESFVNSTYGINITVDEELYTNGPFKITVQNNLQKPPDMMITLWGDPPHESVDIWIDSELNGWDWYRYNDGDPKNPVGNGDDPWANHTNRVYAKVRNIGGANAFGAKVNFYYNAPPGLGQWGTWVLINSTTVNIAPKEEKNVSVEWIPPILADAGTGIVKMHTCLKVEIEPVPGEINTDNQCAQENIKHFEITTGSGFQNVTTTFTVGNPYPQTQRIFLQLLDLPSGWNVTLDKDTFLLDAYETTEVTLFIGPPQDVDLSTLLSTLYSTLCPNSGQFHIRGLTIVGPTTPEFMHFEEIGGITVSVHPVEKLREEDVRFSVTPPTITIGNNISVNGLLQQMPNFTVSLLFTSPSGVIITKTTKTDSEGYFNDSFQPAETGTWRLQVFSTGSGSYSSVLSTTKSFEVNLDTTPPTIIHTPIISWRNNTAILINATITDNVGVGSAVLFYRKATERSYVSVQMDSVSHNVWTGTIPESAVTSAGLEYYIRATDGKNNETTPVYTVTVPTTTATIIEGREIRVYYNGTRNLTVRNITFNEREILRGNIPADRGDIGFFIDINITGVFRNAFITMQYNDSDVVGVDEDTLRMYYWNETTNGWILIEDSGVWTNNNTVWANITHLTIFAPMAEKVSVNIPPTPVTLNIPTGATKNLLTLTWSKNTDSDFASYEIYKSTSSGTLGTLVTTINTNTTNTYTVTGLAPGTTYYFTVRVVDTGELYSNSNQVSATTLSEPEKKEQKGFIPGYETTVLLAVIAVCTILLRRKTKN